MNKDANEAIGIASGGQAPGNQPASLSNQDPRKWQLLRTLDNKHQSVAANIPVENEHLGL